MKGQNHDWMLHVLDDLANYLSAIGLNDQCAELEAVKTSVARKLRMSMQTAEVSQKALSSAPLT